MKMSEKLISAEEGKISTLPALPSDLSIPRQSANIIYGQFQS